MKSEKIIISENQVIGIREFMDIYLGVKYKGDKRLTHYEMEDYLIEKGKRLPTRANYKNIDKSKLANGTYIVVREESKNKKKGKKIVYENPIMTSFGELLTELKQTKDYVKLKQIRKQILRKENLYEDAYGNIVEIGEDEYEVTVKINRQKVKSKRR